MSYIHKYRGIFEESIVSEWEKLSESHFIDLLNVPVVFYPMYEKFSFYDSPFAIGDVVLFTGKIKNIAGYGVFVSTREGKTYWGYKLKDFRVIPSTHMSTVMFGNTYE